MIFSLILKSKGILDFNDSYEKELTSVFESISNETLLSYMLKNQSKEINRTYINEIMTIMKQIVKSTAHIHRKNIIHGNLRPANFVFKTNTDLKSLKMMGFERAITNEDNSDVDSE